MTAESHDQRRRLKRKREQTCRQFIGVKSRSGKVLSFTVKARHAKSLAASNAGHFATAFRALTCRSSGAPTAGRQARDPVLVILLLAGLPSHRCRPLSSTLGGRIRAFTRAPVQRLQLDYFMLWCGNGDDR